MGSPSGAKRTTSTGVPTSRPISMRRALAAAGSLISATTAGVPTASALSGWRASLISGTASGVMGRHRLNHDGIGEFLGETEPGVADLANDIRRVADEADVLFFAQAHLAKPVGDLRRRGVF